MTRKKKGLPGFTVARKKQSPPCQSHPPLSHVSSATSDLKQRRRSVGVSRLLAHSLLATAYGVLGAVPSQKNVLRRGLGLLASASASGLLARGPALLWTCNFQTQLASALAVDGDAASALSTLSAGASAAAELGSPQLELFFAATGLHVHLLCWEDNAAVEAAVTRASGLWEALPADQKEQWTGLFFYTELLQTFYLLRTCDYKAASQHVERLDTAAKDEMQKGQRVQELAAELGTVERTLAQPGLKERERSALTHKQRQLKYQLQTLCGYDKLNDVLDYGDKLLLAPPPMHGEWLPRAAVFVLVDLMVVMVSRPKGIFKECGKRIHSGLELIRGELSKLGIVDGVTEANLEHSTIWTAGLYLMLLLQFLENKVAVELTRSEFVEAQEALAQMINWFTRFPTILRGCENTIEMLRGQYAHSVGCFDEAAFHFLEAARLTDSRSMQSMCQVYASVSYICMGDAESTSQALELVGPAYRTMDSFVGVREKTCIIFVYGLLLMRQQNPQEARLRLAGGLRIAHQQLGNIQLVSQYLTILGTLALQLHDCGQAREILKSSLTLAKTLYDIPTQIWILSVFTELYRELKERENEMENSEYERKKEDDLQRRLSEAHSSPFHQELPRLTHEAPFQVEKTRIQVQQLHNFSREQQGMPGPTTAKADLDIPESVGLYAAQPSSVKRLIEPSSGAAANVYRHASYIGESQKLCAALVLKSFSNCQVPTAYFRRMESDGEDTPAAAARACGAGHRASHSLPTSAGGRVCLSCAAALLSSAASAPAHHVSHALDALSLALADPAFLAPLRAAHPRLLAAPLAEALAGAASRRDAALAAQASDLAADLAAAVGSPAASDLVARVARALSSGSLVKHLHTLHCLGILLNSTKDAATYIGDKQSLYLNLVNNLRLPSDEIRGEILFVLYELSLLNATPWDDICDNDNVDLSAIGRSLLQFSLEVLLKTQNDDVRLNCIALLLTLAKKGAFDILLLSDPSLINSAEAEDNVPLNDSLVILFAEAVKGSLLSTNIEVQTGTLELIFHFLSSDANIFVLKTLIDQNVADYVFEVLRLSEILKLPSADDIQKLPSFIVEASKHAISLTFSHEYDCLFLIPHSLLLLKEALIFCLEGNKDQILRKKSLEDSIIETCETYLLPWLESAIVDGWLLTIKILASVEQYILLNGAKFPHEIPGSLMLTLLVHLYAFVRGISFRFGIPHSPEAEKTLFHAMTHKEWDLLLIRVHLIALKWLFQNEELMEPLSFHLLNFCKFFCEDRTVMLSSSTQLVDIQLIAELVYSGETCISSLLVSLLSQMIKESAEDEVLSVVNVITEILVSFPCTSDQFVSCGIVDALGSIYLSLCSSRIKSVCSLLIFNILHSASAMTFTCDDDAWLALTMKLLDCFNSSLAYTSSEQEWKILIGILCLILNHSANKVLIEPAKAIILNNCLALLMDGIVQEACAKGPSLFQHNQETTFGELLILMLLLIFFSVRSLQAILEASIDWQEFLQYSDDTESSSVLGIPCHDLCRLMHFGPSPVKLIASQCLLELLNRISDQRSCLNAELRCSAKYLKSMIAVTEGMVFDQDSRVAENCGACLTVILGWERFGSREKAVIRESKWSRLILEEFAVALTAPGLTSKSFSNQQKIAANIALSLLQLSQVPDWLTSLFSDSLISGIVANLSARNVTAEIVTLFSELMAKNYLNQEHIAGLHNLFQVCRRQAYEGGGGSKAQPSEQKAAAARCADDVRALLFGMMLEQRACSRATVEMEQQRLLREIDSFFFQESSLREQNSVK
ncbi:hypothetical protein OsI_15436 [Oryza sativa Indica Group]|uniref:Uncharacterized protein n=1 Tax=Oryza sativa subsp. indica TaxID=39946 RepID=B8ASH2_ORYSI|nr:hypothetical protein OsI_15436 [Oryza sativa Indica Group]